jgi:hypothetical protein
VQTHVNVATSGVGVRADLVGRIDQGLRIGLFQTRQADVQVDVQTETARDLADADVGGDRGVVQGCCAWSGWQRISGADEAGRVAGGEQLLRVGRFTTRTAEFFRGSEFDVENVVTGNRTTVTATGAKLRLRCREFAW